MSTGMCLICGTRPKSIAVHLSTETHRTMARPKPSRCRRARPVPSWVLAGRRDQLDDAKPEELAAAEAWARSA